MTLDEWKAKGKKLFGCDIMQWRFVCPSCGHVAAVQDWKNAGAPEGTVAFSCVGRWLDPGPGLEKNTFQKNGGPCDYAGGGLIGLNPIEVVYDGKITRVFDFARTRTKRRKT